MFVRKGKELKDALNYLDDALDSNDYNNIAELIFHRIGDDIADKIDSEVEGQLEKKTHE